MATKWAETEVKRWLLGQKIAMRKVEPSPVLWSMRKALKRFAQLKKKHPW
ncbi:MAG: hypothetical protein HYY65_12605 [Candidatus Tectomicrobia bacterium]|uniref:Uncharacterized protein n=1 Tax=Tectimicrobiota bacterium TaxID=2528274 RepID=A0A932M1V1_UNCTE|nr:hypothetical protein [Candidatus Tectomicrobia bacterium]